MRKRLYVKAAAVALSVLMACSMTGCKDKKVDYSLDEKDGSVKNEQEKDDMDEDNNSDTKIGSGSLAKKYGIPVSCDKEFDVGNSGLSSIRIVDDEIEVPSAEKLSKVYYETTRLSGDAVKNMVENLLDTSKGIYMREEGVMTKDEIKKEIEWYEKQIEIEKENGDEGSTSWYEASIREFQDKLADAPDSLPLLDSYDDPYKQYNGVFNDREYCLSISDDFGEENVEGETYIGLYMAESEERKYIDQVPGSEYSWMQSVSDITDVDLSGLTNDSKLTEQDATNMAYDFLERIGVEGLLCKSVDPVARVWKDSEDETKKVQLGGYYISFVRTIDGVNINDTQLYDVDNLYTQSGYMRNTFDSAQVCIDDDGIVYMYVSAYSKLDLENKEEVTLLSWEEMIEKVNAGIGAYFEKYPTRYSRVEFNSVALNYVAIADEQGKKCYIPAWVFLQSEELRSQEGSGEVSQAVFVNAIDGSIIDIVENAKNLKLWYSY